MEKKPKYKKVTRKADRLLEGKVIARQGKQKDQKLKPYLVLQYLLKYSDEHNTRTAYDIIAAIKHKFIGKPLEIQIFHTKNTPASLG